ncbi:MAG: glycosyltransferase family 39 protein [Gaiellaceae bacterium]
MALAAALLCSRGLDSGANYDEGVYLASADALGRSEHLGEDVFASQPPGFYALVRLATALPGDSVEATRVLFVAVAVLGVVAAWSLGHTLAGRLGGLGAAGVLLTAPAYAVESARVAADGPSVALALGGLALLAVGARQESLTLALAAGVVLATAVSVKLLVLTALVPAFGLLHALGAPRRLVVAFLVGGAAVTAALLAVYARVLGELYDDVVAFHTDARSAGEGLGANVERVARSFDPRLVFTFLVAAGAVAWLVRARRPRPLAALWVWALASAAFLAWQRPVLDHHFVLFAAAFSLPAGAVLGRAVEGRRIPVAALALVVLAGSAQQGRRSDRLAPPEPALAEAAAEVRALVPDDGVFVTDVPLVAYLAGRALPGELVDTSAVRFASGSLDGDCVLELVDHERVRVVVVGRSFRVEPDLLARLEARFPTRRQIGELALLERSGSAVRGAPPAEPESCS